MSGDTDEPSETKWSFWFCIAFAFWIIVLITQEIFLVTGMYLKKFRLFRNYGRNPK